MSVAVVENATSQCTQMATNADLQSGCVPDEALAMIRAAQIAEEFRKFLLVIAFRPQSPVGREAIEVGIDRK
jgi:hypothetical protein